MLAALAVLVCAFGNDQGYEPKVPPPVIPIPVGVPIPWDYALRTDWTTFAAKKAVWRTSIRTGDDWEDAVVDRPGARVRTSAVDTAGEYILSKTTGRRGAGGGVGAGFEWAMYVRTEWTAGVDVEFTPTGPRVVVAFKHYPLEGVEHRYGWSVLSNQLVHGTGGHFREDDLRSIYYMPRFAFLLTWYGFWRSLGLD